MSGHDIRLQRLLDLPIILDIRHFSELLHLDPKRVRYLNQNCMHQYRRYTIPKRNGDERLISQPTRELKAIQAWILRNILDKLHCTAYATAYRGGISLSHNVTPHRANRYFLCLDIEDFFPSISAYKVAHLFSLLNYSLKVSKFLCNFCTFGHGLPQGGITSPALSNLICIKLDRRLGGLASRHNIIFTRYADDLTFSSNNPQSLKKIIPTILRIIRSENFEPNLNKLKLMGPKTRCQITGLVKDNSEAKFGVGVRKKREMRVVMHRFLTGNRDQLKYSSVNSIEGWLSFLKGTDRKSYWEMRNYWKKLQLKYPQTC